MPASEQDRTPASPEIDRDPEETREEPEVDAPREPDPEIDERPGRDEPEMPGRDPRERKPEVEEPPPRDPEPG